jgi:hypothetical protein
VLCETSKLLWGSSFLFRENITAIEKQQNYRSVETLLGEGILQAVRSMVPVKNILRDFVSMDDDVETPGDSKEEEKEDVKVEEEAVKEEVKVEEEAVKEEVKVEEPAKEEVKVEEAKEEEEAPKNEVINPIDVSGSDSPPLIRLDIGANRVGFAEYNSMFDASEDGTDMIKEDDEGEDEGGLEILEEQGIPLSMEDMDSFEDALDGKDEAIGDGDYDVLA